jgi:hypothetical protein
LAIIERRNHPRVKVSHSVLCFSDVYPRPVVGSTVDLSLGGTTIKTPFHLMAGETLEISIAISPKVIKCKGEVVHIRCLDEDGPTAAIRFGGMSKQDRSYLREYVSHIMKQED